LEISTRRVINDKTQKNNQRYRRKKVSTDDFNRSLVSGLADALNEHDLIRAKNYLADDLHFIGVFGPAIEGADAYLDAMGHLRAKQTILKSVVERDDVACFYELSLPSRPDIKLFGCGWFRISNERISSIRVVFDPTPLGKA
jgi:hypothetical protein